MKMNAVLVHFVTNSLNVKMLLQIFHVNAIVDMMEMERIAKVNFDFVC